MIKRGKSKIIKSICSFEIILFLSMSFAVAFVMNAGMVSGIGEYDQFNSEPATSNLQVPSDAGLNEEFLNEFDFWKKGEGPSVGSGTTLPSITGDTYNYKIPLTGTPVNGFFTVNLVEGLVWAIAVVGIVQLVGNLAGLDPEITNALSVSLGAGIVAGKAAYGLALKSQTVVDTGVFSGAGWTGLGVGAIVAFAIFVALYKKEKKKLVSFQCLPFEPPIGGEKCEECNKDSFRPCSEYRCRSLGQACQLLNTGTNEERCAWVNPRDVNSPTISPWGEALKPSGLSYVPDTTIRPPNRGVKITRVGAKDGCIQAFTPLEFGVILNEPAQCKLDYSPNKTFDQMQFYFGGSNYHRYNHTQKMKLPSPETGELSADLAPELENDGFFSLYVQCRDANDNVNEDKFVFNFCVDKSPDTTPPLIEGTSINSGGFVRHNADNVPIELYVNEPAECKWSRDSKNYDDMENSMQCGTEIYQINADLNYVCSGNLTGVKNQETNKFYFRCKDQPSKAESERNVNTQSYELLLKGSQPLNILNVEPNGTIFGSTDTVVVDLSIKTDDGAEEGKSLCYFSATGLPDSYIAMFESNSFEHRQKLDLISGNYKYFVRCIDFGGNSADSNTEFSIFVDKQTPKVTRAYKEEGLKVVTDEDAQCVYDLKSCNYEFNEGLPMIYSNPSLKRNHFVEWKANSIYYIKCGDLYNNVPSPNECSIIVNSVELTKGL
ncbi:MAG: hypothetical protein Q7S27_02445 [Nanoarchaeota archaeon]|nr:hypothetical protein [Nanoarchaeota archaeon]